MRVSYSSARYRRRFYHPHFKDLGLMVINEVSASILFGLGLVVSNAVNAAKEVIMINAIVNSCAWCGVAFLRGHGGTFQSIREISNYRVSY